MIAVGVGRAEVVEGDRDAAEFHDAAGRFDESQHETREGRLTAPGTTDDADRASWWDDDVDVVQHRPVVAVVEVHMGGRHGERTGRRARRALVEDVRSDRHQVGDAHHGAVRLLDGLEFVDDLLERAFDQQHVLEQQERGADRDHVA